MTVCICSLLVIDQNAISHDEPINAYASFKNVDMVESMASDLYESDSCYTI